MNFERACEILEVPPSANIEDVKQSYRKLVRQWHPDHNRQADAQYFYTIQSAYEYIESVYAEQQRLRSSLPVATDAQYLRLPLNLRKKGIDVHINLELTLFEAFTGGSRVISFLDYQPCERCAGTGNEPDAVMVPCPYCPDEGPCAYCIDRQQISDEPCRVCQGTGTSEGEWTVRVSIPRSVADGVELKTPKKGQWGLDGRGDLYIRTRILNHPQLFRRGDDLWIDIRVNIFQAIFGGTTWVPGLDGMDYEIQLPSGSSSGTVLQIPQRGFYIGEENRGDLYATVMVEVPQTLDQRQRYLYEQLLELETE